MELRNKLILATVLLVATTSFAGTWIVGPGKGSHGTSALSTFQDFEQTGLPTELTWSDISTGGNVVNWDYTTAPLDGAQSLMLVDSTSGAKQAMFNFPGTADEVWVAWRYKESADPATTVNPMSVIDVSQNDLGFVRIQTNGTFFGIVNATAGTQVIDFTAGTAYRIKVRWKKGTGANEEFEVWAAAEASGAWGTSQIQTNGTSTVAADAIYFTNPAADNHDQVIDNVIVSTSDIAWSALD